MIGFAEWDMRKELATLWQECFQEEKRFPVYFLNNAFRPENCLVYTVGNHVAAAVYLLPAAVSGRTFTAQAHYVFAAGTRNRFRSRGYMASLLAAAALEGARRGDRYSAVLPASRELYSYYKKMGYSPFFKVRTLCLSREALEKLASSPRRGYLLPDIRRLNLIRTSFLRNLPGSLLWDNSRFCFAVHFGAAYGDRLVCSAEGEKVAYALCRRTAEKECAILEIMADRETFPGLAAELLRLIPARMYRFRLAVKSELFPAQGEVSDFGMLRPLGGSLVEEIKPDGPYLGLPLD